MNNDKVEDIIKTFQNFLKKSVFTKSHLSMRITSDVINLKNELIINQEWYFLSLQILYH